MQEAGQAPYVSEGQHFERHSSLGFLWAFPVTLGLSSGFLKHLHTYGATLLKSVASDGTFKAVAVQTLHKSFPVMTFLLSGNLKSNFIISNMQLIWCPSLQKPKHTHSCGTCWAV